MKIFSNFDTKSKQIILSTYETQYGVDNVFCFGRSRLYWVLKIFLPVFFVLLLSSLSVYFLYMQFIQDYLLYIILVVLFIDFVLLVPVIGRYIEYKMDFILVTPDFLMLHDQAGIFSKKVVTVNEKSIKTISVERKGLLYSIFNNGDIIFLAEGDVTEHGDVTLKWVPKPEKRRDKIAAIMNKD